MTTNPEPRPLGTDFEMPGACIGCSGPLAIRITATGARGCCLRCHNLATLRLMQDGSELQVMIGGSASA